MKLQFQHQPLTLLFAFCLWLASGCSKPKVDTKTNSTNDTYMYATLSIDGISQTYGQLPGTEGAITTADGEELNCVFMSAVPGQWQIHAYSNFYNNESKASGLMFTLGFDYAGGIGSVSLDGTKYTGTCFIRSAPGCWGSIYQPNLVRE